MVEHLSRIETLWSVVRTAHGEEVDAAMQAREHLFERYNGAVRRYLLAALRNEDAADEVFQEFSLRFVRGDFGNVDPSKGRFRSFLKTVVYHLLVDYQRRKKRGQREQAFAHEPETDEVQQSSADDEAFISNWRDGLLERVWSGLQLSEESSGKPHHTVLQVRVANAELSSTELAEVLSEKLGREVNSGHTRVLLHRARDRFAELMLAEVAETLEQATPEALEEELIDLNLFHYCKHLLRKE
jgi:RNA polymerase sigma-70 factor (ECF subfamily)